MRARDRADPEGQILTWGYARRVGGLFYSDDRLPAVELADDTRILRRMEQGIEDLLVEIYPGWRPRVPRLRGWRFSLPDALDVYRAADSQSAADALHRAGFARVTTHTHESHVPCSCCESRFPPRLTKAAAPVATATPATVDERFEEPVPDA